MLSISSAELNAWIVQFIWPFIRVLALFTTAPLLGHRSFPRSARIGLALLITFLIAPQIPPAPTQSFTDGMALLYLLQQLFVGIAIGFGMMMVFAAIEAAGELMGLQMGLSFATFVDPVHNRSTPIIASYLGIMASLSFLALDGHLLLIAAIHESFTLMPIAPNPQQVFNLPALIQAGSDIFRIGVQISLPVMAAMLITNIAMGLLARAAPQLNIFAVGFPLTIFIGFWALLLSLPYLRSLFEQILLTPLSAKIGHQFLQLSP